MLSVVDSGWRLVDEIPLRRLNLADPHSSVGSLKDASLALLYRRRIGWLVTLVGVNIFSGAGIAYFEDTIAAAVALVYFLPLLIDSGGNAGSQAATLAIRALATGDAVAKDWARLIRREISVAVIIGLTMAAAVSLVGLVRAPEIVPVVAATMLVVVVMGSLVGLSLPFVFTRLRPPRVAR